MKIYERERCNVFGTWHQRKKLTLTNLPWKHEFVRVFVNFFLWKRKVVMIVPHAKRDSSMTHLNRGFNKLFETRCRKLISFIYADRKILHMCNIKWIWKFSLSVCSAVETFFNSLKISHMYHRKNSSIVVKFFSIIIARNRKHTCMFNKLRLMLSWVVNFSPQKIYLEYNNAVSEKLNKKSMKKRFIS